MPFIDENVEVGLPELSAFLQGRTDVDTGKAIETKHIIPYLTDPETAYIYYDCSIMVHLDSGLVVHHQLPQVDNDADTLALADYADDALGELDPGGVNLTSKDQYTDILQRMAHSRYVFNLYGIALRIGVQIPIPKLVSIGGADVVPCDWKEPQRAINQKVPTGNYGGLTIWRAEWSLWYTTLTPPVSNEIPANDPSAHFVDDELVMQAPFAPVDGNSTAKLPSNITLFDALEEEQ